MTQPQEAVGGVPNDDTVVAAEPTLEDRFAAVADAEPEDAQDAPDDPDAPIDPEELEADDIEDDEVEPIQAPASWPDEDKTAFAELPRALQERVSAREAEREKFLQSKSRETAQARQMLAGQAVEAIKQAQNIAAQKIAARLPEIPEEPSAHLMVSDPAAYAEAKDYRTWVLGEYEYARSAIEEITSQQQAMDQQAQQVSLQATVELLKSEFPEYLDDDKRPELARTLRSTGLYLGYSEDHLNAVDGADLVALRRVADLKAKADKYDTLMAKRMDQVRAAKKLPHVSRPGAAQPKGAVANQRYAADREAMRAGDREASRRVFAKFI